LLVGPTPVPIAEDAIPLVADNGLVTSRKAIDEFDEGRHGTMAASA
jgi:hypothetical protein